MRSRERLIEVLETANPNAIGYEAANSLHWRAWRLRAGHKHAGGGEGLRALEQHPSPHVRELAAEAEHYINEDRSKS